MAFPPSQPNFSLFLFFSFSLILSLSQFSIANSLNRTHHTDSTIDIHDLFPQYNLPKGLLPNNVKSYTLSPYGQDYSFTIELTHSCEVYFQNQLVRYNTRIEGKLGYGWVSEASGIEARILFIWLTVSGIDVDDKSGMVEFHVGALSKTLPASEFQKIPNCEGSETKSCHLSHQLASQ